MSNETEQSDEILALQSIYDDDIFICDASKQPYRGCITIHLQNDVETFDIHCNGVVESVKYLSPIILYFTFPSDYPTSAPPDFKLSSVWLQPDQLEVLSKKLHEIWEESYNSVILFTFINFLQLEVLDFLNIKFPIDLSEDKFKKMKNFDVQRKEEIFSRGHHNCPVCFCERPGTECVRLESCGHMFCKDCLSGFLLVHINDGKVNVLNCPGEKCQSKIYPHVIKHLVSQDVYERYERLLFQNSLDVMNDVHYCPRPKCGKPVIIEDGQNFGMCQFCNFAFCIHCKLTYHGIQHCKMKSEEFVKLRNSYMQGSDEDKQKLELVYGKKKLTDMVNDFHSENWMNSNSKKCPNCQTNIERSEGCNKMHCGKCNANFCWLCMKLVDAKNPYLHFNDVTSPCLNKLFIGTGMYENNNNNRNFEEPEDDEEDYEDGDYEYQPFHRDDDYEPMINF